MQRAERNLCILNASQLCTRVAALCLPWMCHLPPVVLSATGFRAEREQSNSAD